MPTKIYNRAQSCYFTIDARETLIAKLTEVQQTVQQLLAELQRNEHDKFAAHLFTGPGENTAQLAIDPAKAENRLNVA